MERASPPACRTRSTQRVGAVVGLYVVRARVDVAPARRGRSGRRGPKPTAAQESGHGLPPPFSPPPTTSSVTASRTAISGPTALTAAARTRLCAAASVGSKTLASTSACTPPAEPSSGGRFIRSEAARAGPYNVAHGPLSRRALERHPVARRGVRGSAPGA